MSTLKGVFPNSRVIKQKNFILENVKSLRRKGQCIYSHKETDEAKNPHMYVQKKSEDKNYILPKENFNIRIKKHRSKDENPNVINNITRQHKLSKNSSTPMLNTNNVCKKKVLHSLNEVSLVQQKEKKNKGLHKSAKKLHRRVSSDPNFQCASPKNDNTKTQIVVRNQSTQTLNAKQLDDLYFEGTIRYPSNYDTVNTNERNYQGNESSETAIDASLDQKDIKTIGKATPNKSDVNEILSSKVNFIKLNKERISVANKSAQHNKNSNNQPSINHRKGVIPKYIKNKKLVQEKEQKSEIELLDPDCPEGHVILPDDERKETLRILKKNYQDYVTELNMLPIKTDTLKAQRHKIEIEKQLNKLEEGIKTFSRPKVYVKVNL